MQPSQPTALAELVKSLAGLQQTQHQALMDFRLEQEDRFHLLVQAQEGDRRVILGLLGLEVAPDTVPTILHGADRHRSTTSRKSDQPGGSGAVHHLAAVLDGRVGPVPPPDVAETGHPAGP